MKRCRKCGEEKPLGEFNPERGGLYGRRGRCRGCEAEDRAARRARDPVAASRYIHLYHARRKYGLDEEKLAALLIEQRGRCAICDQPLTGTNEPHIDHCHDGNFVRGLLCHPCNAAMVALDKAILRGREGDRGAPEAWIAALRDHALHPITFALFGWEGAQMPAPRPRAEQLALLSV